jgi:hypothetical protein
MGNAESHDKMIKKHGATLKIEVFEAQCLKDTSNFTTQTPYVQATCLPHEKSVAKTTPCPQGDTAPKWGPKMHNMLQLRPDLSDYSVFLEVSKWLAFDKAMTHFAGKERKLSNRRSAWMDRN